MKLIEILKKRKFLLFNIFFTLYIGINLIGGERGLISYFDKKNTYEELIEKDKKLTAELKDLDHKISLINKNDPDYLDILYIYLYYMYLFIYDIILGLRAQRPFRPRASGPRGLSGRGPKGRA